MKRRITSITGSAQSMDLGINLSGLGAVCRSPVQEVRQVVTLCAACRVLIRLLCGTVSEIAVEALGGDASRHVGSAAVSE